MEAAPALEHLLDDPDPLVREAAAEDLEKIEEQVMSRRVDQPLAHHKEFVKTLYRLYWDAEADDLKSGARGEGPLRHRE